MNEEKMNTRQQLARALAIVFFMPVAIPVQILTPTPGPEWIYKYGSLFEKIAGEKGFRW